MLRANIDYCEILFPMHCLAAHILKKEDGTIFPQSKGCLNNYLLKIAIERKYQLLRSIVALLQLYKGLKTEYSNYIFIQTLLWLETNTKSFGHKEARQSTGRVKPEVLLDLAVNAL